MPPDIRSPARTRRGERRRNLVIALIAAPLVIGSPLILAGLRDPSTIAARWDSWLIFVALPFVVAALVWRRR